MTGLLHRLFACLLVLSLVAGGVPAQAMPAVAPAHGPAAAAQPDTEMPDCHPSAAAGAHQVSAPAAHDCCGAGDWTHGDGCGPACACPPAAAAVLPMQAREACVSGRVTDLAAAARGDPGCTPVPPRRPPIA